MRLIDADNINFHCNYDGDCTGDIDSCKECENYICDFRDIQEQPTAYDIDKVVVELNELDVKSITRYKNGNFGNFDGVEYYIKKRKAIEIVKQGGVDDDVCEWKYTKEIMDNAEFKVGCNPNALKRGVVPNNFSYHDFKYCPYCGKKIKVVE